MSLSTQETIDQYLQNLPPKTQEILAQIRELSHQLIPNCTESITYGIPTIKYQGKNFVHFAGYRQHIGFYPTPKVIEHFQPELKPFKVSKGAVQFPLSLPIPYDLISHMIQYRLSSFNN